MTMGLREVEVMVAQLMGVYFYAPQEGRVAAGCTHHSLPQLPTRQLTSTTPLRLGFVTANLVCACRSSMYNANLLTAAMQKMVKYSICRNTVATGMHNRNCGRMCY